MPDEKDRLGEKLHDIRKAREEQWARQKDVELLEKMRKQKTESLVCPRCQKPLISKKSNSVEVLACPDEHGAWLGPAALKAALKAGK